MGVVRGSGHLMTPGWRLGQATCRRRSVRCLAGDADAHDAVLPGRGRHGPGVPSRLLGPRHEGWGGSPMDSVPPPPPRLGHPRAPLVGADLLEEVGTPAAPESEAAHEPLSVMRRGVRGRLEGSLPQLCGAEPSRYLCLYGWSFCCAVLLLRRWMTKRPAPKWQKSQIVPCCFLAYCDTDMAGTNHPLPFPLRMACHLCLIGPSA